MLHATLATELMYYKERFDEKEMPSVLHFIRDVARQQPEPTVSVPPLDLI